ncbi:MAG: hypothetical protein IJ874_01990 [Ruminococcus sp.]|nr:hypothetical protein [Ruminococcus sp.]
MKKDRDNFPWFRLPAAQVFGVLLIICGFLLMFRFGYYEARKANEYSSSGYSDADIQDSSQDSSQTTDSDADEDSMEAYRGVRARTAAILRIPLVVLGGILIIAAVPLFYVPYVDRAPKYRTRYSEEEEEDETDPEFDYPDDDFDYVLDKDVRKRLIKERNRRVTEKMRRMRKNKRKRR